MLPSIVVITAYSNGTPTMLVWGVSSAKTRRSTVRATLRLPGNHNSNVNKLSARRAISLRRAPRSVRDRPFVTIDRPESGNAEVRYIDLCE